MIAFEQLTLRPEFVEELERRGMDRVAPEIAEEIGVLFEHDRLDPGAREQQPRNHPRRPAADDANLARKFIHDPLTNAPASGYVHARRLVSSITVSALQWLSLARRDRKDVG